jgi:hypothetical protein
MRKTLILTLVLCVFAVIAYAQTGAAPAAPAAPATSGTSTTSSMAAGSTGTAATPPAKHAKSHAAKCTFHGSVVSADPTAKSFVVHPAKGDDMTLKVNDKTKYSPKGKTWDDVKADATVSGTCKKDGADNWAVSVKFAAAKKMKAEPAAKSGK